MSSIRGALTILAGSFILLGCEQHPKVELTSPDGGDVNRDETNQDEMQSVTGHYEFIGINTGNDFKYSLSAIRHADGTISGEMEERVTLNATGEFIRQTHSTVTCFEIVGNLARVGGVVDQATDPRFVPGKTEFHLNVVDNGKGDNDPPDLGSNARYSVPGIAEPFCEQGTSFNLEPVQHGNVIIRS